MGEVLAGGVEEGQLWARRALVGYEKLSRESVRELARAWAVACACTRRAQGPTRKLDSMRRRPHCRLASECCVVASNDALDAWFALESTALDRPRQNLGKKLGEARLAHYTLDTFCAHHVQVKRPRAQRGQNREEAQATGRD
jgi:hypothetical protein